MTALALLVAAGVALAPADASSQEPQPAPPPGAPAAPAPGPATLLVAPFPAKDGAPDWVGLAAADTLLDAAVQQDRDNFLTLKQLDAVLRRRDLRLADAQGPEQLAPVARALGATEVISGAVSQRGARLVLEAQRARPEGGAPLRTARVEGPIAQLPQLLQKLAGELGLSHPAGPPTASLRAMELGARCTFALARQSLAPRSRSLLPQPQLDAAGALCSGALKADPKLGSARAGAAVLLAAAGRYPEARREAAAAHTPKRLVWWATLAEAYAARRAGDNPGSRAALEKAVAARPGFLDALGYLGEQQIEEQDDAGSLKTFERYLARAPGHPWATGKKGRALARLGQKGQAIAVTRGALERSDDPELQLELASRYLDLGDDAEAERLLLTVAGLTPPRPLAFLRLGYLYLRAGKLREARGQFLRAVTEARREDEARTRALAYADLAQVAGREGIFENALEALQAARREGLRKLPCAEPELAKWKGHPDLDKVCDEAKGPPPGTAVDDEDDLVAIELQ